MPGEESISDLLLRWDDMREQGRTMTAAELCRDCPENRAEVEQKIDVLRLMYRLLGDDELPTEPLARPRRPAEPPHVAGYDILAEIGSGGMGVVYKARQIALNRVVALKMIRTGAHAPAADRERFRNEAEAVARLQHPYVVQIHEIGEADGCPYFSLEYVAGGSLADHSRGRALPPARAAELVEMMAQAVQAAHERGIVHRDLKPSNVLLTPDGKPKIADFGLAKRLDATAGGTQTGAVLGTPSYMAPEQAQGKGRAVGPAADVYALGAILYDLLTGRPPFKEPTPMETMFKVVNEEPPPPTSWRADLPQDLETICLKCLAKEPKERYASAGELAGRLRLFLEGKPIPDRPERWPARLRRWVRRRPVRSTAAAAVGTAAALVGITLGVLALVNYYSDPARQLEAVRREVREGKAVTLVPETGLPRWHRLALGEERSKTYADRDQPLAVHTDGLALVELLPATQRRSYRLSADVRHETSRLNGAVGLYFGHSSRTTPEGTEHYFFHLAFADEGSEKAQVALNARAYGEKNLEVFCNTLGLTGFTGQLEGSPGPGQLTRPWRRLVVERTPDQVRVFCDGVRLTGMVGRQPLEFLSRDAVALKANSFFLRRPERQGYAPPQLAPEEGLGLYVFLGSASFRNVVLEPLPEESQP
jgi:serine/threonine protein kinase